MNAVVDAPLEYGIRLATRPDLISSTKVCAFLVDYRRHSHDAFLLLLNIIATFQGGGSQMLSRR